MGKGLKKKREKRQKRKALDAAPIDNKRNKNNLSSNSSNGEMNTDSGEASENDRNHGEANADANGNGDGSQLEDNDITDHPNVDSSLVDESSRHVYIKCTGTDPLALYKIDGFAKTEFLESVIGNFANNFRSLPSGPLLVECDTFTQVQKLLSLDKFLGFPVKVTVNTNVGTVQGVVVDPSVCDIPVETVLLKLKSQKVVKVRNFFSG